jgi:hypothetical protein
MQQRIDTAALEAGRQPKDIRRIYNVMGQIQSGESTGAFQGPVKQWVGELAKLVLETGMDTFIVGLPEPPGDQIERFMAEVVPLVRETVAAGRSQPAAKA